MVEFYLVEYRLVQFSFFMSLPLVAFPTGFLMHPMSSWFSSLKSEMSEPHEREYLVMHSHDRLGSGTLVLSILLLQRGSRTSGLLV